MRANDPAKKPRFPEHSVNWLVPVFLSAAAGAADVIGFLHALALPLVLVGSALASASTKIDNKHSDPVKYATSDT
jgi:hypothetical protein